MVSTPTVIITETSAMKQNYCKMHFQSEPKKRRQGGKYAVLWQAPPTVHGKVVETQYLGSTTTQRWVAEGRSSGEEGDIIEVLKGGKMVASCLPDLSDLAVLPDAMKIVLRWCLKNEASEHGRDNTIIDHVMDQILWHMPRIPHVREWCWIEKKGCHEILFSSYMDTFKDVTVSPYFKVEAIRIGWKNTSNSQIDGRKWCVQFNVVHQSNICGRIKRYIVWNCKGMGQTTFVQQMQHIIDVHAMDCLILTETRCSDHIARCMTRKFPHSGTYGASAIMGEGGAAVVVFADDIRVTNQERDGATSHQWSFECP